jgi:hypothetical protein
MGIFEFLMLLSFGLSWPFSIAKTLRLKKVDGKSPLFMSIIILGYMFGIIHKILYDFNWVIWVYVIDACLVLVDLSLYCYYKNKKV